ncbi:MAG: immunoglobulin domain-containing protein [Verrucomicrobia bacterium]|nr:immunoglobulin domain-containing protein [Verrucomicrobiota bacterium]
MNADAVRHIHRGQPARRAKLFDSTATKPRLAQLARAFVGAILTCWLTTSAGWAAVTITSPPVDQSARIGDPATFSVSATGTGPLTYQWSHTGVAILEGTNSTLNLTSVSASDSGVFLVTITDSTGAREVGSARLLILLAPTLGFVEPMIQDVFIGGAVTLNITVYSDLPVTYQWLRYGHPIAGATSAPFTIPSFTDSDIGLYSVEVSNAVGTTRSLSSAFLRRFDPPTIWYSLTDQDVLLGDSATFVAIASGGSPMAIQWFHNGQPIAGATNSALFIEEVQTQDAGYYAVEFSNAVGKARSGTVQIRLASPPSFTTQPQGQHTSAGRTVMLMPAVIGTAPLSYQWHFNNIPIPFGTSVWLTVQASAATAGEYRLDVRNLFGRVSSDVARIEIDAPPADTTLETQVSVVDCRTVSITWSMSTAEHPERTTYRLFRDGQVYRVFHPGDALPNETNLVPGQEYSYQVVAYDGTGVEVARGTPVVVHGPDCTDRTPPNPPSILGISPRCDGMTVTVSSTSDTGGSGLSGYKIYLNGVPLASGAATVYTYSISGLAQNTRYICAATAIDGTGNESALGPPRIVTTPSCPAGPPPPQPPPQPPPTPNSTIPAPSFPYYVSGCGTLLLKWDVVNPSKIPIAGFEIYRDGSLLTTLMTNRTDYLDETAGLVGHNYDVYTIGMSGARSDAGGIYVTAADCRLKQFRARALNCKAVSLSWVFPVTSIGGFISAWNIYRDEAFVQQIPAGTMAFIDTNVVDHRTYSYSIRPVTTAGVELERSGTGGAYVPACPDVTPPGLPSGLVASPANCGQIDLQWQPVTDVGGADVRGYRVFKNGHLVTEVRAPATNYSDYAIFPGRDYTYAISAVDWSENVSALSKTSSARTPTCPAPDGTIYFSTHLGGTVDAPANFSANTSAAASAKAQLFLVQSDGSLEALEPATEFRPANGGADFYVKPAS